MKKKKLDKSLLIRCSCHSFEFIELGWFDDEPKVFYITITCHPKGFIEKIKGIWRIIKGSPYGITDDVLISNKEAKKIITWFKERI